jgi:hypothetical protein
MVLIVAEQEELKRLGDEFTKEQHWITMVIDN